jgi:predicted 2-oxoglutarate/Fe(II)-dependent dioxygenase YbiX
MELIKREGDIFIINNVLSPEECSAIINECEEKGNLRDSTILGERYQQAASRLRTSQQVGITVNPALAEVNSKLFDAYGKGMNKLFTESNIDTTVFSVIDEGYTLLKYSVGGKYGLHVDDTGQGNRKISILLYLNDDYEGGETAFPRQGVTHKGKTGSLIFFPSGWTHPHESKPLLAGTKYATITWLF